MSTQTKPLRIFVVDDHKDIADGLADVLRMKGHEVEVAYNGQQAIRIFREKEFDISFMDVMMPGMNGVESFMEIRKIRPAAKVIMMTGYSVEQLLDQAVQEGACGILHKPINIDDVLEAMDRIHSKGMVLIADDDPEFSGAIKDVLMDDGYKVCVARTGGEALKTVMSGGVDYLVLDLKLPVISGLEVYLQLRNRGHDIPTVIVTGQATENAEALDAFRSMEVTGILTKPFDTVSLLQHLDQMSHGLDVEPQPQQDTAEDLFMAKPERSEDRPRFNIERSGYTPEASAADEALMADEQGLAESPADGPAQLEAPMDAPIGLPMDPMAEPEAPMAAVGAGDAAEPQTDAEAEPAMFEAPAQAEPLSAPDAGQEAEPFMLAEEEPVASAPAEPYGVPPMAEPEAAAPEMSPSHEPDGPESPVPAEDEGVAAPATEAPSVAPLPAPAPASAPVEAPVPVAQAETPASAGVPAPEQPPAGGFKAHQRTGRILAVDDDVDLVEGIAEVLRATGYEVETAKNEQEAQQIIQTFDAQVALLDIRLGRTNGLDLIPYLKEYRPEIYCVVITGNADKESAITALRSGAFDYLTKPLALDKLFAVLDRCLGKFDLRQRLQAAFEELQDAKNVADQQSQEATTFFARYSEELRQLVDEVNNRISPLVMADDSATDDEDGSPAKMVRDQVGRLYDLIECSNAYVQASSGRSDGKEQRLDICGIAEHAVEEIQKLYGEDAPKIAVSLPADRPVIWGREHQILEMLVNMLAQASDMGGEEELLLGLKPADDGGLLMIVKGAEVELDAEDLTKLLQPFGASEVVGKIKAEGNRNPMRLPLAAALAKAHDGALRLHGGNGQPFIASVTLPASRITQPRDDVQAQPEAEGQVA
ncbi:MAG: response regulator [Kiloniellales bacterium]|nr:response regulator [Kiloniellales bacterium]